MSLVGEPSRTTIAREGLSRGSHTSEKSSRRANRTHSKSRRRSSSPISERGRANPAKGLHRTSEQNKNIYRRGGPAGIRVDNALRGSIALAGGEAATSVSIARFARQCGTPRANFAINGARAIYSSRAVAGFEGVSRLPLVSRIPKLQEHAAHSCANFGPKGTPEPKGTREMHGSSAAFGFEVPIWAGRLMLGASNPPH